MTDQRQDAIQRLRQSARLTDEWWTAADGTRAGGVVVHVHDLQAALAPTPPPQQDSPDRFAPSVETMGAPPTEPRGVEGCKHQRRHGECTTDPNDPTYWTCQDCGFKWTEHPNVSPLPADVAALVEEWREKRTTVDSRRAAGILKRIGDRLATALSHQARANHEQENSHPQAPSSEPRSPEVRSVRQEDQASALPTGGPHGQRVYEATPEQIAASEHMIRHTLSYHTDADGRFKDFDAGNLTKLAKYVAELEHQARASVEEGGRPSVEDLTDR